MPAFDNLIEPPDQCGLLSLVGTNTLGFSFIGPAVSEKTFTTDDAGWTIDKHE